MDRLTRDSHGIHRHERETDIDDCVCIPFLPGSPVRVYHYESIFFQRIITKEKEKRKKTKTKNKKPLPDDVSYNECPQSARLFHGHKRQEITLRHDSVVNALYHHSDHSGAAACKEPQGLSTEDGRRPDLQIILPGACILTDVVVSHPLCPSYVSLASSRPLAIARRAANYKQLKYKDVAATQLAHFIPFAVETTGGLSQDAKKLIDQLSLACKDHLTLPSHHTFANTIHASVGGQSPRTQHRRQEQPQHKDRSKPTV